MKLTLVAGGCHEGGTCPAVLDTEGDDVLVQGLRIFDHGLDIPPGEDIVRLPRQLILDAARRIEGVA